MAHRMMVQDIQQAVLTLMQSSSSSTCCCMEALTLPMHSCMCSAGVMVVPHTPCPWNSRSSSFSSMSAGTPHYHAVFSSSKLLCLQLSWPIDSILGEAPPQPAAVQSHIFDCSSCPGVNQGRPPDPQAT
eukprot:CAMPEP_0202858412 /NCGR_PEP_ID=MMETSP1391-20130828/961_1 /ASSEMBLY_ACC=CAM_ASM_000867 /TAXON_ID=1034604 /ORGANISM="Chlamydomonas leiostraca, Strain SAG 11-49" /LENGTH=128 /DNA_ID=CAMNT_0049537333 /DNA_START=993 /DNA_END=1380 /DNA_ORIENTATION=+